MRKAVLYSSSRTGGAKPAAAVGEAPGNAGDGAVADPTSPASAARAARTGTTASGDTLSAASWSAPGTSPGRTPPRAAAARSAAPAADPLAAVVPTGWRARWRARAGRHGHALSVLAGGLLGLTLAVGYVGLSRTPGALTQRDIDQAVLHTLNTQPLPQPAAKAYAKIRPSVVRVRAMSLPDAQGKQEELGAGSGVVIVDGGVILTNLHVAQGAPRLQVVFADGHESAAELVGAQPENDLAVIKARSVPDDLVPATMRSTADLQVGERVVAVGFPFGIGPTTSSGVVSGLKREFRSPEGKSLLTNLIQFDAAANPGSSGGPLVTDSGEVVGIVTAILNPTEQRVFIGIGFAVPIENAAAAAGMPPF